MLGKGPRAQTFGVMSTSSDSGEENEKIREAIDPDFLTNDIFRTKESKDLIKPVSLRNVRNSSSSYNPLEIKATPEFRAHVSKFLRKKLDQVIDDTQELPENDRKKCRKSEEGGIRLLRTSSNFMSVDSDQEIPVLTVTRSKKVKRKQEQENDDSSSSCDSNEKRAKEVAVTAEWILSGKATEGWATNTKGELEIINVPVSKRKCHGKK